MSWFTRSVLPPVLFAALALNCSPGSGLVPTATQPHTGSSTDSFTVQPVPGREILLEPAVAGRESVVGAASQPTGAFRTTPAAGDDRAIRISVDDLVAVSGARFTPGNPDDELKVEVEWGDGERSIVPCGPCRVDHVYRRAGRYELTATIHDRRLVDRGEVTETFTVLVQGPPEPASAPGPLPANCSVITRTTGACPTGRTTFCVDDPFVDPRNSNHALAACNACHGAGACSNFNVTCFGAPTTTFQASVSLANLTAGFVYSRTSATGPLPGDVSDFLAPSCPTAGRWGR